MPQNGKKDAVEHTPDYKDYSIHFLIYIVIITTIKKIHNETSSKQLKCRQLARHDC